MNKQPLFTSCSWILLQKSTVLMKRLCPKLLRKGVGNAGVSWCFHFWSALSGNLIHFLIKVQSLCFAWALIFSYKASYNRAHTHTLKSGYSQRAIQFLGVGRLGREHIRRYISNQFLHCGKMFRPSQVKGNSGFSMLETLYPIYWFLLIIEMALTHGLCNFVIFMWSERRKIIYIQMLTKLQYELQLLFDQKKKKKVSISFKEVDDIYEGDERTTL